jgi:hypothetical protein
VLCSAPSPREARVWWRVGMKGSEGWWELGEIVVFFFGGKKEGKSEV